MIEEMLDPRLVRDLRAYAEGGIRPFDPVAIADAATRSVGRRPSLRILLLAAAAILALAALAALGAGRSRGDLPAPFGLAANGAIAFAVENDLYLGDPVGGSTRLVAPGVGANPVFSRDGTAIAVTRAVREGTRDDVQPGGACYGPRPVGCQSQVLVVDGEGRAEVVADNLAWPAQVRDWSPDGQRLLVTAGAGQSDAAPLWLIAVDGSVSQQIGAVVPGAPVVYGPSGTIWVVSPSPAGPVLQTIDPVAGRAADVAPIDSYAAVLPFTVSPRADVVAIPVDGGIALVRRDGRLERTIGLQGQVQAISFSPAGDRLATVVSAPDGSRAVVILLDTDTPPVVVAGGEPRETCAWAPDATALLCLATETGAWLDDPLGGPGHKLPWDGDTIVYPLSWQRLAP